MVEFVTSMRSQFGEAGAFSGRAIILLAAIVIALILQRLAIKFIRSRLSGSAVSSISLFENIARAAIWTIAFIFVCEPVFDVQPTGLVTAFGVGSLIISLGLQDTIANVFSGLQMAAHKVVKPGDHIEIGDVRGEVTDVNWRQTTIEDKDGDTHIFPNSMLNKTALKQLSESDSYRHIFTIEIVPSSDLDAVSDDIVTTAKSVLEEKGFMQEGLDPQVRFLGATAYGIQTSVRIFVKSERMTTPAIDAVMRALKERPYLSDCTNESPAKALPA